MQLGQPPRKVCVVVERDQNGIFIDLSIESRESDIFLKNMITIVEKFQAITYITRKRDIIESLFKHFWN